LSHNHIIKCPGIIYALAGINDFHPHNVAVFIIGYDEAGFVLVAFLNGSISEERFTTPLLGSSFTFREFFLSHRRDAGATNGFFVAG